jgi:RNA polymerase sigma-70 factor (ECF subfamily)
MATLIELLGGESVLTRLRKDLLKFATLQLRNADSAEDVVQDTLLAAFNASEKFQNQAAVKTWIFSILKNKMIDLFRSGWHKHRVELNQQDEDSSDDFEVLFNSKKHWEDAEAPSAWGNPEQTLHNQQFWTIFEACLNKLPAATSRVFMMREFLGLETEQICQELQLKTSNCWVILHRARMQLRLCLEQTWFKESSGTPIQ